MVTRSKRLFDHFLVRPPSDDYPDCHSDNPAKKTIDIVEARQQYREYVSLLRESGIKVTSLTALDGFPDSVFLQDPMILDTNTSVLCRFGLKTREGEEKALLQDLLDSGLHVGSARSVGPGATLEGGDVMITDYGLFAGIAGRSNGEGVEHLQNFLAGVKVNRIHSDLFHLLSGVSYIGSRTLLVAPSVVDKRAFADFKTIEVPDNEAYAANTLYLGEGRVLMPAGYPKTRSKLRLHGYDTVELNNSEFWKAMGESAVSHPLCTNCSDPE